MSTVIGKWGTVIFAIIFMTTPILTYIDSLHRDIVDVVAVEAAKKAAIEGRFTVEILDDIRSRLVETHNFNPATLEIEATTELTPRNEYLELTITVPRSPIVIFDIFYMEREPYSRHVQVLSEYIPTTD